MKTKKQRTLTLEEVREMVEKISIGGVLYDRPQFRVMGKGDGYLLQLVYMEADVEHPEEGPVPQHARKWYVSAFSTETEIVRTVYKAVLCSLEHRLGEFFTYKGRKVYNPHFDVGALGDLDASCKVDVRD